jgi:CBS domain-containing protein
MSTVLEILATKGDKVVSVGPDASVLNAAIVMNEHRIGAVAVMDQGRIVGMFTERDVLQRIVAQQREPATTRVGDVMSTEVVCCTPETTVQEARNAMKNRRIRRLPVVAKDGKILGLISIGDLNAVEAVDHERTIHLMNEYLYGRV